MTENIVLEKVDTEKNTGSSVELCVGEVPGARPFHHVITCGSEMVFESNTGYYHILILIEGKAQFITQGNSYEFDSRTTFVPAFNESLVVKAETNVHILEIQWKVENGDEEDLKAYGTQFPVVMPYKDCIQYTEPEKSEKTISRMMIPHEVIPRFAIGSVESYGYDLVRPHAHPTLDQLFFSFPENDMEVIINGKKINMKGNMIIHIPLGSEHGVEVTGDRHMHYVWIDFMPDKEAGLKQLNASHQPTGVVRDFANEGIAK